MAQDTLEQDFAVLGARLVYQAPQLSIRRPKIVGVDEEISIPPTGWFPIPAIGYWIAYTDSKGQQSERRISAIKVRPGVEIAVRAWCYERDAWRMFLTSRIHEMWMLDTGEVIENPSSHFSSLINAEPIAQAVSSVRDSLDILSYFARCDGCFDAREAEAMADFVEWPWTGEALNRSRLLSIMRSLAPLKETYTAAIKGIGRWDQIKRRELARGIRAVVDADGRVDPVEADLMIELADKLSR